MKKEPLFVGIDVSKSSLDLCIGEKHFATTNDAEGISVCSKKLRRVKPELIVLEATGGYEFPLAAKLAADGLPVSVVNPRQIRDFARACGILAKTDQVDAKVLREFAEKIRPECRPLQDEDRRALAGLVKRRKQLLETLIEEKNRLDVAHKVVIPAIKRHIEWLKQEITAVDKDISGSVKESPVWMEQVDLLASIPGIGRLSATTLMVLLPEMGRLNSKKISSLAGLAPFSRDSGRYSGKRSIRGGRASVRRALYMCALVASRANEQIKSFYERLLLAGKPKKLALTACMRKLLVMCNAVIRDSVGWRGAEAA